MTDKEIITLVSRCYSINEITKKAKAGKLRVLSLIALNNLDTSHFLLKGKRKNARKVITKICKACNSSFNTKNVKQTFCSYKCSNSFEPHNSVKQYQSICFKHHKKECVICRESIVVDVHHYDENHYNNDPKNLVPLCPTHHRYMHNETGKSLIRERVDEYVANFKAHTKSV